MPVHDFIYLASKSPRRAQLLDLLGVAHRPLLADEDEDAEALEAERVGETPLDYVQRVTHAKLLAARARLRQRGLARAPILCADTTVALGRRILGKPQDAAQAGAMLSALSGRSHRVITIVALAAGARRVLSTTNESRVRFAPLSKVTIARCIASGEPFGKAGAYAIQGAMACCIAHIAGSHSGIMGLPLFETAELLRQARVRMTI